MRRAPKPTLSKNLSQSLSIYQQIDRFEGTQKEEDVLKQMKTSLHLQLQNLSIKRQVEQYRPLFTFTNEIIHPAIQW